MFVAGTGSLTNVFGIKDKGIEHTGGESQDLQHGKYIKYPMTLKTAVDNGSSVEILCDICESGLTVLAKCLDCCQNMCYTCTLRHKNMRSSIHHHFVSVDACDRFIQDEAVCIKHKERKTFYCLKCSEALCIYCKLLYHTQHETKDLLDSSSDEIFNNSTNLDGGCIDIPYLNLIGANEVLTEHQTNFVDTNKLSYHDERCSATENPSGRDKKTVVYDEEKLVTIRKRDMKSVSLIPSIDSGRNLKFLKQSLCDLKLDNDTFSVDSGAVICNKTCKMCFL